MRQHIACFWLGLWIAAALDAPAATGQVVSEQPTGMRLEAAAGTGLGKILTDRRLALEKRDGGPLKGHAWWLWGLGSFDYDLDGDLDLIVCIHGSTDGLVIRNELVETGSLTFTDVTAELGVDRRVPSTDNYPLMWDFDGDGYLDIAGLLNDSKTPCLWNRAGRRFSKASFSLHPINYPDEIRDLNGDGYVDISQSIGGQRVRFFYDANSASFTKTEIPIEPPAGVPEQVRRELGQLRSAPHNRFLKVRYFRSDLNGDGRGDWIVRAYGSYSGDRLGWYLLADNSGSFGDHTKQGKLPRDGAPLLWEDLDRDGDVDLLIASGKEAGLFLNDGHGIFARREGPLTEFVKQRCPYLQVVKRADLDGDGDLDLAISNRRYGRQMVLQNLGEGSFQTVLETSGWDADPLVLRDIDNDGRIDVIVGGAGEKENIGVFLNQTQGFGNVCRLYLRREEPNVYAAGAKVELFRAGTLGRPNAFPVFVQDAHLDGSPIHLGLRDANSFDLRVRFDDDNTLELKNVASRPKLYVNTQGIAEQGSP